MKQTGPYADIPFQWTLGAKAEATPLESGAMLIEGWGANWSWDLQDERFSRSAFNRSLKKWLAGSAPLCYAHRRDEVIGKVIGAEVRDEGVWLKAIVDPQPVSSPLRYIIDGIRRGRIAALSCAGVFKRKQTPEGPVITDVELVEWSAAPISIGRGTSFQVIAGKALTPEAVEGKAINAKGQLVEDTESLREVKATLTTMRKSLEAKALADEVAELRAALTGVDRSPLRPTRTPDDAALTTLGWRAEKNHNHDDNLKAALT